LPHIKTYSKNSKHLIKLFELYSFVICALFQQIIFPSNLFKFFAKNLFIALYLTSPAKSLPPHAYLYMRKVKSFNVHVSRPQNLTLGGA